MRTPKDTKTHKAASGRLARETQAQGAREVRQAAHRDGAGMGPAPAPTTRISEGRMSQAAESPLPCEVVRGGMPSQSPQPFSAVPTWPTLRTPAS
jgi:hypothetical protein